MRPATLPPVLHRLGRRPDPWAWPDWRYAGLDGTFGNRFDDPHGLYRVLYGSTERLATFVECLAPFRPDPVLAVELAAIEASADDADPPPAGVVPRDWLTVRCVGTAVVSGVYVDLGHHDTIAVLRRALGPRLVHYHVTDLDASTIRLSTPRALTQEISRYVFDTTRETASVWNGICYRSRYGDNLVNWAIFERQAPTATGTADLDPADPDLSTALTLHGLRLEAGD